MPRGYNDITCIVLLKVVTTSNSFQLIKVSYEIFNPFQTILQWFYITAYKGDQLLSPFKAPFIYLISFHI